MNSRTGMHPTPQKTNQFRQKQSNSGLGVLLPVLVLVLMSSGMLNKNLNAQKNQQSIEIPKIETRFRQHLYQLSDSRLATRNQAEKALIESGNDFLRWLDGPENQSIGSSISALQTAESRHRLERIRMTIFEKSQSALTKASTISITSPSSVSQLAEAVYRETGNRITLPVDFRFEQPWGPTTNQPIEFWKLIDELCRDKSLSIDYSNSSKNTLALELSKDSDAKSTWDHQAGIRCDWPESELNQISLLLTWEPKLQPWQISVALKNFTVTDQNDQPWGTFNNQAILNIPVTGNRNNVTFRIPIRTRQSTDTTETQTPPAKISLPVRMSLIGPDAVANFRGITATENRQTPRQIGMSTISIERVEKIGNRVKVQVDTKYDSQQMADPLQSHRDWSIRCRANLVHEIDGEVIKVEPIDSRQLRQTEYFYSIEYSFQLPDDMGQKLWDLQFAIPSGLIESKQTFHLNSNRE